MENAEQRAFLKKFPISFTQFGLATGSIMPSCVTQSSNAFLRRKVYFNLKFELHLVQLHFDPLSLETHHN
jgi:hypothetical protein